MNLKLVELTKEYEPQLIDMMEEWIAYKKANPNEDKSPMCIFKNDYRDFDYYVEHLGHKVATKDRVPDTVYFALDLDRNIFVGGCSIRHYLNDRLLIDGGHIGDGVRPSERRKGYATEIIGLALLKCKELGIDRVLICCNKTNIGSAKSIINNGGVLEDERMVDDVLVQRYWINLK